MSSSGGNGKWGMQCSATPAGPHTQWVPHTYTYDEYDTFQYFLVDGYKQYAHRYFISDFLLFADNVNQPDLLPFSHRCFLAIPLHHR